MDRIAQSLGYVQSVAQGFVPEIAIILGSGLNSVADCLQEQIVLPYSSIPGFPVPSQAALGHEGKLVLGKLHGHNVCAFQGRIHYYEHCDMEQVLMPTRLAHALGANYLFVTNASGSVNISYRLGDLVIIDDHINMIPNPLMGIESLKYGDWFTDMSRPYDPYLIALAEAVAGQLGINVHTGVYIGVTGPSYETAAENKFFRLIGADAVGMSTTPEVIAGRQMGMRVFGISLITGLARDAAPGATTRGEDVIAVANRSCKKVTSLMEEMIKRL